MSEPLDLDALERVLDTGHDLPSRAKIRALIAELRATRAEFEQADLAWTEWEIRAHRAEAAIARALARIDAFGGGDETEGHVIEDVRTALRGDG